MKYDRYELIYRDMSPRLRDKFINTYNIIPSALDDNEKDKFNDCMKNFIESNPHNLELRRSCESFPELKDIPHPDLIPESWGLNQRGREIMKDGYIEKIEEENADLHEKNDELKSNNDILSKIISDLEKKLDKQKKAILPLTDENAELKVYITDLEKECLNISDEKSELNAELAELKAANISFTDINQDLEKLLNDLIDEKDNLNNELTNLQITAAKHQKEKAELKEQIDSLQKKAMDLCEKNTELKLKLNESISNAIQTEVQPKPKEDGTIEPDIEITKGEALLEQFSDNSFDKNSSDADPASSIYNKFFLPPMVKNRYRLLSEEEQGWLHNNAGLSELETNVFDLCCKYDSLKDVAEKTDLSYSKTKRISTVITGKIRSALDRSMTKDTNNENTEG